MCLVFSAREELYPFEARCSQFSLACLRSGHSGQGWLLLSPDDRIKQGSSLTENLNCVSELGREREQTGKGCVCVFVRARKSLALVSSPFSTE